ncbi:hypothetical protein D9757_007506 [Collybiopsis confluens]|uniref:F-box domain-containing protein n=1 Tax=Collybiopsis confluens TaxID=2823264 RepID=A0A8H5HJB8_9AGAR|nr:hypothetical protein D9757_007506 [Collybiopsis confluens]
MHQVLEIPEIVHEICLHCNDRTNASNARVCKLWSDISLDVLWYECSLRPFLGLFGELERTGISTKDLSYRTTPTIKNWQRFEHCYQRRIRVLRCPSERTAQALKEPLIVLSLSKPQGALLPNLHTIDWVGTFGSGLGEPAVMFMHSEVRCFMARISEGASDIGLFLEAIPHRVPNLSTFEIWTRHHQSHIAAVLQNLPNLKRVRFPAFSDSSLIMEAVSKSQIEQIHCNVGIVETLNLSGNTWSRTLQVLDINCTYSAAARLFKAPLPVTYIRIASSTPASPKDVQSLISFISQTCTEIQSLDLDFTDRHYLVVESLKTTSPDRTTLSDIEPLLSRHDMKLFSLSTGRPILMNDEDLRILACSWPKLKRLRLSSDPGCLEPDRSKRLTLLSLVQLAQWCPELESIGLYLDATTPYIPQNLPATVPAKNLENLKQLDIGFSPLDDSARVASVLSQILPSPSAALPSTQQRWQQIASISPYILGEWKTEWEAVRTLLPVLLKFRQEKDAQLQEKVDRIRDLENEILMLREQALGKVD